MVTFFLLLILSVNMQWCVLSEILYADDDLKARS